MGRGRLVVLCCALLGGLLPSAEAFPRDGLQLPPRPAVYENGARYPDDEYDAYDYDNAGYDEAQAYDAPVPARRRPRRKAESMLEVRSRQPAGIDRDDNGVVGDFDGEPAAAAAPEETAAEIAAEPPAELMTPDGQAAAEADEQVVAPTTPATPVEPAGPPPSKLELALGAIKEDIMKKSRQVGEELTWIAEVKKITEDYAEKSKRVEANVEVLRGDVTALYKKKKQIENLMLQKELQAKLKDANEDLGTLDKALGHVKTKEEEFVKTKNNIQDTISGINGQLKKLEGKTDENLDDEESENEIEEDIKSEM